MKEKQIQSSYETAKEIYASRGINTDKVVESLEKSKISLHVWQADDVSGFENTEGLSGGIQVTGAYAGKARNIEETQSDVKFALSLVPGKHKVNLHAIYGDFSKYPNDRDQISPENFKIWVDWAKHLNISLDFNPTFFSHKMAESDFTLSSKNETVRNFWIEHGKCSREIAAYMGKELGSPAVNNIWIPDGYKDIPINRLSHRKLLKDSLDQIFSKKYDKKYLKDAVESKLFGLGLESYTVGSHEFYMGYAISNPDIMLCLDAGHFHPTEDIADKISSILLFKDELLLHVSRPVRWDSDHVVIFDDSLRTIMQQIERVGSHKVNIALDYFDGSINRVGAMVLGMRSALKAILSAKLEPVSVLEAYENKCEFFERLAYLEESKFMPVSSVWDYYCLKNNVPPQDMWIDDAVRYQNKVTKDRS